MSQLVNEWSLSLNEPGKYTEIQSVKSLSPTLAKFLLPVFCRTTPADSSSRECGQEEHADPNLFKLNHLSASQSGGKLLGCMDALCGAGKSQTLRLPAVILRVIVSGEQQKALRRTGMQSARAKLLSPVTSWALFKCF